MVTLCLQRSMHFGWLQALVCSQFAVFWRFLLSFWLNTPGCHQIAFVVFSVCRGEVFAGRRSLFQDAAWRWDVGGSIGCSAFAGRVFRPQGGHVVVRGLLYKSPGGNLVDGLPPVAHLDEFWAKHDGFRKIQD